MLSIFTLVALPINLIIPGLLGTGPILVGYLYAATGGWMALCISHGTRKDIQQ